MTKQVQFEIDPFYFHYPAGAAILTSHAGGRDNAMAVAWHTALSYEPPCYGVSISPARFTHGLIAESSEFVVNFMPFDKRDLVAQVAGCSGRDVDKFARFGMAGYAGSRVKPLVLEDASAAYECRMVERRLYGDHELFVGRVVAVHWDTVAFGRDGKLDIDRVRPALYMGEDDYAAAADLAHVPRGAGRAD